MQLGVGETGVAAEVAVFRGVRVRQGRWVDHGEEAWVTFDSGQGPRTLARVRLHPGEVRHCTGFDWGNDSPGAAELARAVLVAIYPGSAHAREPGCYRLFAQEVIARLPHKEFRLTGSEVRAWFTNWFEARADAREQAPAVLGAS